MPIAEPRNRRQAERWLAQTPVHGVCEFPKGTVTRSVILVSRSARSQTLISGACTRRV